MIQNPDLLPSCCDSRTSRQMLPQPPVALSDEGKRMTGNFAKTGPGVSCRQKNIVVPSVFSRRVCLEQENRCAAPGGTPCWWSPPAAQDLCCPGWACREPKRLCHHTPFAVAGDHRRLSHVLTGPSSALRPGWEPQTCVHLHFLSFSHLLRLPPPLLLTNRPRPCVCVNSTRVNVSMGLNFWNCSPSLHAELSLRPQHGTWFWSVDSIKLLAINAFCIIDELHIFANLRLSLFLPPCARLACFKHTTASHTFHTPHTRFLAVQLFPITKLPFIPLFLCRFRLWPCLTLSTQSGSYV